MDNCVQDLIEEHWRIRSQSECSDEQRNKTMIDVLLSLQDNELEYFKDELIRGMMQGVFYVKKDYDLVKYPDIDVPNLQVIKLMQSFKLNEYV
ncbi:40S ribosomal protein S10-2 [Camellia lanceoleosa]|uniref:40S ribosomal protein S10-2 n=1 Tax=Camellia lanceoleosa TaxID=1840588 RepID=A0ACC0HK45_9ERIC|nr:40S ribosomal protein S10-2 [Camellia lanceoleosa]